ncbi:hypothetical protein P3X46_011490 [Hevea brasiliensis]|uniref:DUF4408 domain-containing protein n=1 Tax=Hevea brasiliensis TaxID=3981 RepID=A0ABQ9M787_HEVBR|nr:hypothetical protein P3X46_011490 [Hevea brasiliensis]
MDTICKAKKLQAIDSHKTQFLHNIIFHLLVALTCSLISFYPYWFPSLCSSLKQFLFQSLSSATSSSIFIPMCWFVVVNVIVVFLVGESMFVGSHSSPAGEIYDEYVERSRSLRGVPCPSSTLQEKAEQSKAELNLTHEDKRLTAIVQDEPVNEEIKQVNESISRGSEEDKEVEAEAKTEIEGDKEEKEDEEEEESGLPTEELNKRVEEFIARVNKQRRLEEASLLVSCSA